MERGDSHVATVAKSTEAARFNTASLWEAGTLPSRSNDAWSRGADTAAYHLPGLMLTNGDHVIADAPRTNKPFALSTTAIDYASFADSDGIPAFGGKLDGYVDSTKPKSNSYYSITLGFQGRDAHGVLDQQTVNVNISDAMKLNGKSINDGVPHRGVFPIVPEKDAVHTHWNWVDATITMKDGRANLAVHRMSPSSDKPTQESQWDQVNMLWNLKHQRSAQHASARDYWTEYGTASYDRNSVSREYWNTYRSPYVMMNETAK